MRSSHACVCCVLCMLDVMSVLAGYLSSMKNTIHSLPTDPTCLMHDAFGAFQSELGLHPCPYSARCCRKTMRWDDFPGSGHWCHLAPGIQPNCSSGGSDLHSCSSNTHYHLQHIIAIVDVVVTCNASLIVPCLLMQSLWAM